MHVTDENVDEFNKIAKSKDCFLKYYMPGCGHCIAMEQEWEHMKDKIPEDLRLNNDIVIGEVKSESVPKLKVYNDILGYPTIVYLKNGNLVNEYDGERKEEQMLNWIINSLAKQSGGKKTTKKHNKKSAKKHNRKSSKKHNRKSSKKHHKKSSKKYNKK